MNIERNVYFIGENTIFENDKIKQSSIKDCLDYLKTKKVLGLDIETTCKFNKYKQEGLDPYTSKIVMLQIGDLERQYIIDVRVVSLIFLKEILENPDIVKVGHNLKFEYLHILHNLGIRLKSLYDTQIVEQVLYSGIASDYISIPDKKEKVRRFSLESLIYIYFKHKVEKDTRLQFLKIKDTPFSLTQIYYGADDIIFPLLIKKIQEEKLVKQNLNNTIKLEMQFLEVLSNIEYNGLKLDKNKWKQVYDEKLIVFKDYENKLNKYIEDNYQKTKFVNKQLDLFSTGLTCNIKWTSSKQVIEFLRYLDACPQEVSKTTKKLEYTVNAKILKSTLLGMNKDKSKEIKDFINLYLQYKELEQATTTFGIEFFKYINPISGRLHTSFKQILNTGRISSTKPNLQNIPSDKRYRECFIPEEGNVYIDCDYGGQETVILANVSGEENISYLINTNGDMHSFVTRRVFPELMDLSDDEIKNNHKDKRQISKAAGFAVNYGGNGFTIAKNLGISTEEGDKVYDAYFEAFPTLKEYFTRVQNLALRKGYILIDNITNRKRYFNPPKNNKEKHSIMKNALNSPIQGTGGSMTKLACIYFYRWIEENNLFNKVKLVNVVHDELLVECTEDMKYIVSDKVEECMIQAADVWCKDVKMKADAQISNKWEH